MGLGVFGVHLLMEGRVGRFSQSTNKRCGSKFQKLDLKQVLIKLEARFKTFGSLDLIFQLFLRLIVLSLHL